MEAACLLPAFLTVLLLVLQPICLLYTQAMMESAASQTARLMVTAEGEAEDAYQAFALRRLAAVPDVSIFHAGGPLSWDVSCTRGGASGACSVSIEGYVRPLPILGAFVAAFGERNARGDVRLVAEVSYEGRPSWLEGTYDTWVAQWDE